MYQKQKRKDRISFERVFAEHEIAFHGDPDELDSDLTNLDRALYRQQYNTHKYFSFGPDER